MPDPNLFALDFERALEVIATIAILAIMVERALAPLFESRWFIDRFEGRSLKEPIAFILGTIVALSFQFDALAILLVAPKNSWIGYIITGGVIAGERRAA